MPDGAEVIAKSKKVPVEVLRFREKPWYTFQAHIEREWEYACPEAYILWQNMLRKWKLAPAPPRADERTAQRSVGRGRQTSATVLRVCRHS